MYKFFRESSFEVAVSKNLFNPCLTPLIRLLSYAYCHVKKQITFFRIGFFKVYTHKKFGSLRIFAYLCVRFHTQHKDRWRTDTKKKTQVLATK